MIGQPPCARFAERAPRMGRRVVFRELFEFFTQWRTPYATVEEVLGEPVQEEALVKIRGPRAQKSLITASIVESIE